MATLLQLVRRLVALLVGAALLGAGGAVIGQTLRLLPSQRLAWAGLEVVLQPAMDGVWIAAAVLAVVLGLSLAFVALLPGSSRRRAQRLELPGTPDHLGLSVTVAARTLESLLRYESSHVEGVRRLESDVTLVDDGWAVRTSVFVGRERPMRDIATELDRRLRHALFVHTGLNVSSLDLELDFVAEQQTRRQRVA
jgi:hypothetical protein